MTDDEIIQRRKAQRPVIVSSGFTPETLAQALADARAVRETALANAKEALREAFENNGCIVETD